MEQIEQFTHLDTSMQSLALLESLQGLVFYHKIFAFFFIVPIMLNLYHLFFHKNLIQLNKRIWYCMPLIFFLFSVALLSGLNIVIFNPQSFGFSAILMSAFCLLVLVGEIMRLKILKVAKRTSLEAMQKYIKFAKILYFLEALFYALILLVCFV
ncbi:MULTISPECIES: hypothetical protein [unclassified Helicobacter]|uniref:hypothetical protein n=1 Tax=unclassified Helicobacter TaxID=2593540 RepID=UPI0021625EED|nr:MULTISPECIES: hypothetical protein [unclassified Helicobacter]